MADMCKCGLWARDLNRSPCPVCEADQIAASPSGATPATEQTPRDSLEVAAMRATAILRVVSPGTVAYAHDVLGEALGRSAPEATPPEPRRMTGWPDLWCETCRDYPPVTDDATTNASDAAEGPRDLCCSHCGLVLATYLPARAASPASETPAPEPSEAKPLFTDADHDAISRACEKLWNGEPPENPIHGPRPASHPLVAIANAAHRAANNASAEIGRLNAIIDGSRSSSPSEDPPTADVIHAAANWLIGAEGFARRLGITNAIDLHDALLGHLSSHSSEPRLVERVAEAIYDAMRENDPEGKNRPWAEGGNSLKQDEARDRARKAIESDRGNEHAGSEPPSPDYSRRRGAFCKAHGGVLAKWIEGAWRCEECGDACDLNTGARSPSTPAAQPETDDAPSSQPTPETT